VKDIRKVHVKFLKTINEGWDALKNQFQAQNVMNMNFLTWKIHTFKMKEEKDVKKHIIKFKLCVVMHYQ
jgi:hypothetical protein